MKSPERAVALLGALAAVVTLSTTASAEQYPPPQGGYQQPGAPPPAGDPSMQQQPPPGGYQQPPQQGYPQQQPAAGGYQQPGGAMPPQGGAPMGAPGGEMMTRRLGGWAGQFILSADRLFGFSSYSATIKPPQGDEGTSSGTCIYLLWGSSNTSSSFYPVNVAAIPRLSFDVTVTTGLTVGGSLGYISVGGEDKSGSFTQKHPDISAFVVGPRVGYAIMFSDNFGIWPRLGFTYLSSTTKTETTDALGATTTYETKLSGQTVDIDGLLVISPMPNMGITIGPVIDIGVGGKIEEPGVDPTTGAATTVEEDISVTTFGVAAGLLGYF
jgi:hypothetical protein